MFRIRKVNKKNIAEEIKSGDIVQHFKRTDDMQANEYLYRIIAEAKHTETNEYMVVYQAMYGDFQTYARPMAMFLSPVDKEKYPDAKQEFRFEKCQFSNDGKWLPEFQTNLRRRPLVFSFFFLVFLLLFFLFFG